MSTWIQTASSNTIQTNGLKAAIVVGTFLNLINQGDALLSGAWSEIQVPKLLLTYCVPYYVAEYAGTQAKREKA
ncbi:MAG: nitrate/nitrite transporter NrtS [Verrucomicrobia bacterium]|nr:nitrate/nitrite transporter NrtS [Verrucomicrobiota bacterium]MDA1065508.1 nitrate/nitrite transporter NrtS [Verrucomicrobiota bacterium]